MSGPRVPSSTALQAGFAKVSRPWLKAVRGWLADRLAAWERDRLPGLTRHDALDDTQKADLLYWLQSGLDDLPQPGEDRLEELAALLLLLGRRMASIAELEQRRYLIRLGADRRKLAEALGMTVEEALTLQPANQPSGWATTTIDKLRGYGPWLRRQLAAVLLKIERNATVADIRAALERKIGEAERAVPHTATDRVHVLAALVAAAIQTRAGTEEYDWYGILDHRIRPTHRALHGTRQRWSVPPPLGPGHPGQPPRCRCHAVPVIPAWLRAHLPHRGSEAPAPPA